MLLGTILQTSPVMISSIVGWLVDWLADGLAGQGQVSRSALFLFF
jgi:hypothetical protein